MGKEERCIPNTKRINHFLSWLEDDIEFNDIEKGKKMTLKQELVIERREKHE